MRPPPGFEPAKPAVRVGKLAKFAPCPVLISFALLFLLASCEKPDGEQSLVCERLIAAVEETDNFRVVRRERDERARNTVVIHYRLEHLATPRWVRCAFSAGGFDPDRLNLTGFASSEKGSFSDIQVFMLRRYWLGRFETQAEIRTASPSLGQVSYVHYLGQQGFNGLTVGAFYGILAVAYTLVFALIKRINLAFGEFSMLGSYGAVLAVQLVVMTGSESFFWPLIAAFALGLVVACGYGAVVQRFVFAPLQGQRSQAVLIATIGLAIFLQELVRLSQGAGDLWLQPVFSNSYVLAESGGFTVTVTPFKMTVIALAVGLYAILQSLLNRTNFGRHWRACADDPAMAALSGVNVGRVVGSSFLISSAYAAVTGVIVAVHYGGANFHMGTMLGFKALTAAVIGGIGSLPGAVAGGLLVGLVETFFTAYFSGTYRDVVIFAFLGATLIFRPHGLLGQPDVGRRDQG